MSRNTNICCLSAATSRQSRWQWHKVNLLLRETPAPRLWFKSKGSKEKDKRVSGRQVKHRSGKGSCVGTFDCDAFAGPLLLKRGEAFPLADADDVLFEVKLLGVKAEESQPQLSHRLGVRLVLREAVTLQKDAERHT